MSYYILFWGPSTVSMAFLAYIKTHGFGRFSQLYELLHNFLGSFDNFEGISGSREIRGFGPLSQFYELLYIVLGSVNSFEGISGIYQNSWIWSFLAAI